MLRQISYLLCLILVALILPSALLHTAAQNIKPVLVLFHDIEEDSSNLADAGNSALQTGLFAEVVLTDYDWKNETVPEAAARLFKELTSTLNDARFVLYGFGKGGLIAEWIASRVREADGRIARVITVDTAFDGLQKPGLDMSAPGLQDIAPTSPTLQSLRSAPLNNIASVEFIRLWERGNEVVIQDSALRKPSGGEARTSQLVVRTKPFDPREVIPEMLAQAKKDFESEQFAKVVDACRYILKVEPKHGETNGLLGMSLYNSAMQEADQAQAAERFGESIQYLAAGLADGMEYKMPAAHHHNFGTTPFGPVTIGDVCYGRMFFSKGVFGFVSADNPAHRFLIPVSKVYGLSFDPNGSGRLHLEVGYTSWRGKEEKRRQYNFLPVRVTKSTTILPLRSSTPLGINKIGCNQGEGCHLSLQALYRFIAESQKLPNTSDPTMVGGQPETIETVHYALRAKNKHAGVMSFSASGLQWKETSSNADPKHNFTVPWEGVRMVSGMPWGLQLMFEDNKKLKRYLIECDTDQAMEIAKLLIKHGGVSTQPW